MTPQQYRGDGLPPHVDRLRLNADLTGWLRDRARQEGTTVHGTLSAALVLASYRLSGITDHGPFRVCSPIDVRNPLGLGEKCTLAIGASIVSFDQSKKATFWDLARPATNDLAPARTLESHTLTHHAMRQLMINAVTHQEVDTVCTHGSPTDRVPNFGPERVRASGG